MMNILFPHSVVSQITAHIPSCHLSRIYIPCLDIVRHMLLTRLFYLQMARLLMAAWTQHPSNSQNTVYTIFHSTRQKSCMCIDDEERTRESEVSYRTDSLAKPPRCLSYDEWTQRQQCNMKHHREQAGKQQKRVLGKKKTTPRHKRIHVLHLSSPVIERTKPSQTRRIPGTASPVLDPWPLCSFASSPLSGNAQRQHARSTATLEWGGGKCST